MVDARAYDGDPRLVSLFSDYWQAQLRNYPTYATYLGDHRYDSLLTDESADGYARRLAEARTFLERIQAIPLEGLTPADSLNHRLFERILEDHIADSAFRDYLMPVTQQGGPPLGFAELPTYHPFHSTVDYDNYIARLRAFPAQMDQVMANMRTGMEEHLVPARITMEKVIPQLDALQVRDARKSVLYAPATQIPDSLADSTRSRIEDDVYHAVRDDVMPAYRRLQDFIRKRYLRACRREPGIWALPDGEARYARAVAHYTTTDMTPDEIFQLGEREMGHIRGAMRGVTNRLGYRGNLIDFMNALRINPKYYYDSPEELMQGFRTILKGMDEQLPNLFGHLPKQWYDLREIESFRAESAPAAYYYGAPDDGSRPAYFYVNTSHLESRPKYTMEALAYHEAVPGHHLQLTIQQELTNLPEFRRHGGYTAYVEGWALYAEALPKEVGMYAEPYSEFGRLTFDAWRAARLIVDTGIHHFKWSRERAIEYLRENTALSDADIVSEVERYIAWPGQALAYKIGQIRILEIREKAQRKLRQDFDEKRFHDALLADGALPLDLLQKKMDRWIVSETQRIHEERAAKWREEHLKR